MKMAYIRPCSEVQRRIVRNLLRQHGLNEQPGDIIYKYLAVPIDRRRANLEDWLRDLTAADCVRVIEGLRQFRDARANNRAERLAVVD
jgi:hypothetical protein